MSLTEGPQPLAPNRAKAVLALLRQETTYDAIATEFGVSPADVQRWEADFIAGGTEVLDTTDFIVEDTAALNLAGQDLVELESRIDEARARLSQISALNAISQSLSAILDLDKLLETTLDTLHWVFGYIPSIALVEGEDLVMVGGFALDGNRVNWYDARLPIAGGKGITVWVATNARPLVVPDVLKDERYVHQEIVGPVRSELSIPMIWKNSVIGVLDVVSEKVGAFDTNDVSVLETVAFQLAVSIENARLFGAVQRRVSQLELVQSITSKAIANFDVPTLIDFAVGVVHQIMGYSGVAIGLVAESPQLALTMIGSTPDGEATVEHTELAINDSTVIGSALQAGQMILANEVRADPRFALNPLRATSQSELVVPLRTKDRLIGAINVESDQPGAFDDTDIAALTLLADQLIIAIHGADLVQQTQAQLREISLFRRLADEAIVGIITRDSDGVIEYTNAAAAEMFGFPDAASMRGKSMGLLYADHPWQEFDRKLCVAAARDEGWSGELRQRRQDNQIIVADVSVFPIFTPDGTWINYGMVIQDATQRRELIDAIQRASARFLAVLEATEDGIIVWDDSWRVLFVNKAAAGLLDCPVTSLIGALRNDPSVPALLDQIADAREDEQITFTGEETRIGKCRNLRWHSDHASGYLTVIHDITSQIVLEEAREELTSMLVHDLRGPLTSIVGGIDLATVDLQEEGGHEEVLNYLTMAHRGGNLLLDLTNSLMDIRQLETGAMKLKHEPLRVDAILDDVMSVLSNTAQAAQIQIEIVKEKDLPSIFADNVMVRRALSNLLDNALKFTPDGGNITLSARCEPDPLCASIRFGVADTGPGVPEAFRRRIFEKYTQVPNQRGRRRGTGLGLAFCRLVADAHHGRLWVEPRPGGGSIFSLVVADVGAED